jgi:stage III sporulation protein AH
MKIGQILGKKQVVVAGLVLALGVAVYLNYFFAAGEPLVDAGNSTVEEVSDPSGNLGDATFVDGNVNSKPPQTEEPATEEDYFSRTRENRAAARAEALELLQDSLADAKLSEEMRTQLLEKAAMLASAVEREAAVEALITAKGFEDCVVYIHDDMCTVVVKAEQLTKEQTLQVTEIVTEQAGIAAANVKISARI